MNSSNSIVLVGYSGHAYVLYDIFQSMKKQVIGYCENEFKQFNPYDLMFYGTEDSETGLNELRSNDYFIAIGNNTIRKKIVQKLINKDIHKPTNAIHSSATIGSNTSIGNGVMIAQNVVINAQTKIEDGVVCNTSSVIEHEVEVGSYSFIAPNSTLLGGVKVGQNCFIGANAVILQNIKIGDNCIIGAGSVVLNDIPANSKIVGNPARFI